MKKLLLSGLMFATMSTAAMSTAALAAEPLTDNQLDAVTAGVTIHPLLLVSITGNLNSTTGLNATFTTLQTYLIVP